MPERGPSKLERVEALLETFPIPERDWEEQATAIEARLASVEAGSTSAKLLEPPLPTRAGEGSSADPAGSARGAQSLSALARSLAQKPARASDGDLAKQSLATATVARSRTGEVIERVANKREEAPGASGPSLAQARPAPPAPSQKQRRGLVLGPWVTGAGLAVAAAAVFLLFLRGHQDKPPHGVKLDGTPATGALAQPEAPAPAAEPAEPDAATVEGVPEADARGPEPEAERSRAAEVEEVEKKVARAPAAPARPAPRAAKAAAPKPDGTVALAEEPSAPSETRAPVAAGPAPPGLAPAAGDSARGGLPDRPSTGAAQAAVGSVMSAARACVAGASQPSTARIVFSADGSVQSVTVLGPAAGTPAAGCIEAAVRRARVAPFAQPSFSLSISIRP